MPRTTGGIPRNRPSTRVTAAALTAIAAPLTPAAQTASVTPEAAPTAPVPVSRPPACAPDALEATAYQAAHRPPGTGTGAAIVQFTNVSARACALRGHPTVAVAGNGSPERFLPLKVTRKGVAAPVRVAPGGKAWVKLTFVQVQGEADGYCVSGATPSVFPTLVVGLPGAGKHHVALEDGQIAECDNKVTVTVVSAVRPS
ncbi:DUF4232 domain-containing protein [Streptomyces sp. NPDC004658]|uniref:DUF4232 domain-containing protein n=1 Tax=Streptomyces sp. NPDC004658 TaxID=3154672 RepID=UPI0033A8991E